jgi:hypothetical protein
MNSESWGCEEAVSALAHYIQDKEITKVMVLTFFEWQYGELSIIFLIFAPDYNQGLMI